MEKAQIGAAGKSADCDASSPFSRSTSTTGLDSHHALSVGNRSYQSSSSPSSSFMRNNHHMSMAMGTLDHAPPSSVDNSSHSADSCWSSVPTWEHQQPNGGNMEAAAAGEYASSGWDIKSGWDWEAFVPVSGRGDGGRRLPSSDFDLGGSGAVPKSSAFNLGAVSMASAASGGTSQKAFTSGGFASSTPSAISQGSGIPGLAPTGGGAHGNFSSPSEHTFTPDSSARNAGMDFRVKAEVETPLGLDPQQEQARKSGSLQDLRASSRKTSPNAGVIPDQQANGMSPIGSPQQHQPQTQQQPQQQQRASSQASMLGMGNGIEQQRRLYLGLGGVSREVDDNINNNSSGSSKGTASEDVKDGAHTNGVDGAAVVGEAALGLKLGRRTYFEDGPAGVGTATGTRTAANSPGFAGSPPGKKQRSQPPAIQIPRCQVEGCKADLSNAKEYHRRHKVCEVHSKAAKVIVNKQEQRFCQQCSRFHELSEFDEGKRSCRRRLAGHNERRRKPQPDSGSAITCVNPSLQTSFYGDDDKRNGVGVYLHQRGVPSPTCLEDSDDGNSLKLNHVKSPWPGMGRMDEQSSLACQIQGNGAERPYLSRVPLAHPATTSDRLLMLLQSSPKSQIAPMSSGMSASGVHQFLQGPGPIGQGLTLSSPSGAGVLAGLEATPASQGLSGISDSGRALSLLSSQPWVSRATSSVSLDLSPRSTLTLDQLLAENRAPLAQQLMSSSSAGGQQHFSPLIDKLSMQPHSPGNLGVSGTLSINGSGSGDRDHHGPFMSGYQDFGSHSMLALLQGQEIRASLQSGNGQHVRPTIDLMQLPSPQSQSNHHATRIGALQSQSGQYSDFALRGFESSMFDTQQML